MLTQRIIDKSSRLKAIFADPRYARVVKEEAALTQSQVNADATKARRDELTRQLWAEMHSKIGATAEWFTNWMKRVPSYGCKCRDAFEAIIKANPPRFNDWFTWTVEVHNAVNRKLGRKEWTVEEAKARWTADFTE